ncbi:MAG TPA: nuclear transport factor 2 family protein [Thermoanaerobaculia bacterium]|jgi:ketosteroid isomerase-like protein|nr:nuclear transport factor 2 family protein [Thermoanaerobaculia bacterium]
MDTKEVGTKLVELCQLGKNLEAIDTLYSDDIVSVEARGDETMPAEMRGIAAIRGKSQWWLENHEVHAGSAEGPMVNGDRFTVIFEFDITPKQTGERVKMKEVALYSVDGGKIVREEFYY